MLLPISRVVVMEDRAQVERRAEVTLTGSTRLEVAISPLVVDRSLRVEVQGGTFVDARIERRWKSVPAGGLPHDASALRTRVKDLERSVAVARDALALAETRLALLAATRADVLRGVADQAGAGRADASAWSERLATISAKQDEADGVAHARQVELDAQELALGQAVTALAASEEPQSHTECTLIMSLSGTGPALVRASYLVPCAVWRPTYRATLNQAQVMLEADAMVWQRTGEDWTEVELHFSTARPTLGTNPPSLVEDVLRTRPRQTEEKRVVEVSLREEVIQAAGEGGVGELPGLDDGGEARLLDSPGRRTVIGDGQPHRVPLFSTTSKASLERVCPAELSSLVFLVAKFQNESGRLLLSGPVDLVRDSGFVGRSQLGFCAPGEVAKLSFGSEDGLTVVRDVEEKIDEARLTGRRTTRKTITLHVSNARNQASTLLIEERVPVSEVKEVEVQVLTKECQPQPQALTRDGIARILLELPAHGTRLATFTWELAAAAKVAAL